MKIRLTVLFFIVVSLSLSGCFRIYMNAPPSGTTSQPANTENLNQEAQTSVQPSDATPVITSVSQSTPIPPLPDLVPTKIIYDDSNLQVGKEIFFDSGILNAGTVDSEGFNIKWFVNDAQLGYGGHPGIAAGTEDLTSNSQFYWTPNAAGKFEVKFLVDSDDTIQESGEENNAVVVNIVVPWGEVPVHMGNDQVLFDLYTQKAEVDLNGDGIVDTIEFIVGKTTQINNQTYSEKDQSLAQKFAIIDIDKTDKHLEMLVTPIYREVKAGEEPLYSVIYWWTGEKIKGYRLNGVVFDGDWGKDFKPSDYFDGKGGVFYLTAKPETPNEKYWGYFVFDPVTMKFNEVFD